MFLWAVASQFAFFREQNHSPFTLQREISEWISGNILRILKRRVHLRVGGGARYSGPLCVLELRECFARLQNPERRSTMYAGQSSALRPARNHRPPKDAR